ncbi:hypothetical protein M2169_001074 [Streptomyces sp. MJP52]|nr:hypothetical protein [Streptomyces sp. MJP52]
MRVRVLEHDWPSFRDPKDTDAVGLIQDTSHGMVRTEVRCARCDWSRPRTEDPSAARP